jgi:hypothetical protein
MKINLILLCLLGLWVTPQAYSSEADGAETKGGQSLGQAAEDPTASLMAFQLSDWFTTNFHGLGGEDANNIVFRPVIPFETGDLHHIFRLTVPFTTSSPFLDSGLSDITAFDLMVFNESWGRWGIGPVALFPTGGSKRGADKWGLGPAVGFTARSGKLLWGLFNQNIFNIGGNDARRDVNVSIIQPIVSYGLGHGWSVGTSEMTVAYDWEAHRWSSLPLGLKVAKLVKIGGAPVQFSVQYEHDFANDHGDPENTIRFTTKLLLPK